MGLLDSIQKGAVVRPRRTLIYGVGGVGKSTFAAQFEKPIFIPTEDGNADIPCDSFPLFTEARLAWQAIMELGDPHQDHDYKTVVLDSADWLENLFERDIDREGLDTSYGKGNSILAERFGHILRALNICRDRGMDVIIIAHADIKRFESPEGESYDRYMPKLSKQVSALVQEWADEVLFATYKTFTVTNEEGFGRKRSVGVGNGNRVLRTEERPGWLAKNRLQNLPPELPLLYQEYAKYLPKVNRTPVTAPEPAGDIQGAVKDGSSKPELAEMEATF